MTSCIPEFGLDASEAEYILRPGGYAVIFSNVGEVAVVSAPGGLFLPGGGQDGAESPEEAAVREACEECGLRISLGGRIGVADELVFAADEGRYYRKRCTFFFAENRESTGVGEPSHELIWLSQERDVAELRHESQQWAITTACRLIQPQGEKVMGKTSLYERLGGYDAISAVANDLLQRLQADSQLVRYWQHRGEDGVKREKQLLIDFLCSSAGGPLYYTGRDMKTSHVGMKISESDWSAFLGHLNATLDAFQVPQAERDEVVAFVQTTKADIVEA